jgi:hypothetical protein
MTGRTSKSEDIPPVVVRQMAAEAGVSESDRLLRGKAAAAVAGLQTKNSVAMLLHLIGDRAFSEGKGKDRWYPESVLKELKDQREPRYRADTATAEDAVVLEAGSLETQLERMLPGGPVARIEHELELENVRLRGQVELLQSQAEAASALHEAEIKRLRSEIEVLRSEIEVLRSEKTQAVTVAQHLLDGLNAVKPTDG